MTVFGRPSLADEGGCREDRVNSLGEAMFPLLRLTAPKRFGVASTRGLRPWGANRLWVYKLV